MAAPAILLESDGHGHLAWTLNFDSDWPFSIYWSDDGLNWGHSIDGTDGGARSADESGMAGYFRICQCDWDGNDILPYSNVVYSDGLPPVTLRTGLEAYWAMDGTDSLLQPDAMPAANDLNGWNTTVLSPHGTALDAQESETMISGGMVLVGEPEWSVSFWVTGAPPVGAETSLLLISATLGVRVLEVSGGSMVLAGILDADSNEIVADAGWGYLALYRNHYVVTKTAAALCIYQAGELAGWVDLSASTLLDEGGEVSIPGSQPFKYDEVGIWNRALTAAEVTALYNSGNGLALENF